MKHAGCAFMLFHTLLISVFSQTPDSLPPLPNDSGIGPAEKHPLIAGAETLFINGLFLGITGPILQYSWAQPTAQGIRENFLYGPLWEDTDGFKVNQIGHPWQGGLYFNAGRANGFTFYESMAFTALGSFTWEMICESTNPSINDMITTTFASAPAAGEMLHRLYLEADTAGVPWPLSFLISPADGINKLVTGKSQPGTGNSTGNEGNLHDLTFFIGGGYAKMDFTEKSGGNNLFSFDGPAAAIGLKAVYGNPFAQHSAVPYEHFEFDLSLDFDAGNYIDMRIVSDGYLFSFSPLDTAADTMSTGLSLHFDVVTSGKFSVSDSTIDHTSNALDWTVKYRHIFQNGFITDLKLHAGATFFGVSEYFSPNTPDTSLKNYGGGTNIKLFFDIAKHTLGKLSFSIRQYSMWTFPETSAISSGNAHWLFADVQYSKTVTKHLSLGAVFSTALEYGYFANFTDTRKWSAAVKTFIAWNL
jgi:hypothetical protein